MHTVSPQNPDLTAAGAGRPDVAAGTSRASNPVRSLPGNGECAGSSAADHPRGATGGAQASGSDLPTAATTDQKVGGSSPSKRASQIPPETPSDEGVSSFPGEECRARAHQGRSTHKASASKAFTLPAQMDEALEFRRRLVLAIANDWDADARRRPIRPGEYPRLPERRSRDLAAVPSRSCHQLSIGGSGPAGTEGVPRRGERSGPF